MAKFTIQQAIDYTGKSESTIRRLVKKWSVPSHAYSKYVEMMEGQYFIEQRALQQYYKIPDQSNDQATNQAHFDQEKTAIAENYIEHLKEENRNLHGRVKELTHIVAQQNNMLAKKDEQVKLLEAKVVKEEKGNGEWIVVAILILAMVILVVYLLL